MTRKRILQQQKSHKFQQTPMTPIVHDDDNTIQKVDSNMSRSDTIYRNVKMLNSFAKRPKRNLKGVDDVIG